MVCTIKQFEIRDESSTVLLVITTYSFNHIYLFHNDSKILAYQLLILFHNDYKTFFFCETKKKGFK